MPRILRLSCRALLILVLVTPNFYSALLAGWFGCFSCLSTLSPEELQTTESCQDTCWFVPKWSRQFICWRATAMSLCHVCWYIQRRWARRYQHWAIFVQTDYSTGPYWYLLPCTPYLEKWGYKIFFPLAPLAYPVLYPHLKIRGAAPESAYRCTNL